MIKLKNILLSLVIIIIIILVLLSIYRFFSSKQLDDVSTEIQCDEALLKKADILFIISKFNNTSISQNKIWCNYILSLNKTLGLHGVYHTYNEFGENHEEEYLQEGMEEFFKCFGFYPN